MRVLVVAALGLGVQLYYWYEIVSFQTLSKLFAARNPETWIEGLIALCLSYLILDAICRMVRGSSSDTDAEAKHASATSDELRSEGEPSPEITILKEKVSRLETALRDAEQRNESAKASRSRSDVIDAELVHLLSLLQDKGRFIDFLMEDVTVHPDAQVAAVARVVHQGCADVINEYFSIKPMHQGDEGESVTLETSFNPREYRLVGSVHGQPPFSGTVLHRGWITEKIALPRVVTQDSDKDVPGVGPAIIAPAEIEIAAI